MITAAPAPRRLSELHGRPVYTRTDLVQRRGLGLSTLEKLYRRRADNGHPDPVGKVGRSWAWDAAEWDAWYDRFTCTEGLLTLRDHAERLGVSKATTAAWWWAHAENGHPEPVKRIDNTLWFDAEALESWRRSSRADGRAVPRAGAPGERITLAEFARNVGISGTAATNYANSRPPRGWPEPVDVETLPGGRLRRWYTRQQAWDYAAARGRHGGGRPAGGGPVHRQYPYDGDPRLGLAREALQAAEPGERRQLPRTLAARYGGAPGTWCHILAAARRHPGEARGDGARELAVPGGRRCR